MPVTNISTVSGVLFVTQGTHNPQSFFGAVGNYQFADDNSAVSINIYNQQAASNFIIPLADLRVNGQTPANATEAKVLLNAVFPNATSGSGGSGASTFQETLDEGSVLDKDNSVLIGEFGFEVAAGTPDYSGASSYYQLTTAQFDSYVQGVNILEWAEHYLTKDYITSHIENETNAVELKLTPTSATLQKDDGAIKEIATVDYLVYTALLSQSGTDAPTVFVLQNTLGGPVVWTRDSPGVYHGTLAGAFTANKTWPTISDNLNDPTESVSLNYNDTNFVVLELFSGTDYGLDKLPIKIEVHP